MRSSSPLDSPRAVLVGLAALVLVVMLFAASTSMASLSVFNSGWDGSSALQSQAEQVGSDSEIAFDVAAYDAAPPDRSVALVLSPETSYEQADVRAVRTFVREGGTLVVAEDFGPHGDDLLARVGADARFDGRTLRDERYNFRSPAFPVATNGSNTTVTDADTALTLNHGTAVVPNGATVALTTSEFAYLDANGNGRLDGETLRPYPVVTVERVGEGRVVAVGDPSAFLNAMLDRPGNLAFVRTLLRGQFVLMDVSHAGTAPPVLAYGLTVVRDSALLQAAFCAAGIAALLCVSRASAVGSWLARRRSEERSDAVDREALLRHLRRRHPDWDERRLRRIIADVMSDRTDDTDDDGR
jgi:hypothetical protein